MKHINFINALSPQEQQHIARWYRIALAISISMVLVISSIHIWQIRRIIQARSFYHALLHNSPKYEQATQKYKQATQQHEQLTRYCKECELLQQKFQQCIESLALPEALQTAPEILLASWKWTPCSFNMTLQSPSISHALNAIYLLQKLPLIDTMILISLQSHDQKTAVQLQGTTIKSRSS